MIGFASKTCFKLALLCLLVSLDGVCGLTQATSYILRFNCSCDVNIENCLCLCLLLALENLKLFLFEVLLHVFGVFDVIFLF